MNVEVYIPNPRRCYNCQVFGHHEDNCLKKPVCGNCGGEKHCSDVRNCNETAKCANCNGNHPVSSCDCPSWKKEKEILTIKYKRSITFFEARKIVEEQQSAPGKSNASITKGAVVRCTDAQTDVTYDIQLPSSSSGGGPTPKSGQNAGGGPTPATQTSAGGGSRSAQKPSPVFEKNKDGASSSRPKRGDQNNAPKKKIDTDSVSKGSDDPIKSNNIYDALSEEGMEAETTPASPRKGHIARLPPT